LLVDGKLYFNQTNQPLLSCLDAKTGKVLMDRERLPGLTSLYASPTAVADRIYIPDRDGTTLVIKRSTKVEVLATNRLDDALDASPVIVGNAMLLRGNQFVYCIEETSKRK
jgi:outer membrane protein assembly factor BamB